MQETVITSIISATVLVVTGLLKFAPAGIAQLRKQVLENEKRIGGLESNCTTLTGRVSQIDSNQTIHNEAIYKRLDELSEKIDKIWDNVRAAK